MKKILKLDYSSTQRTEAFIKNGVVMPLFREEEIDLSKQSEEIRSVLYRLPDYIDISYLPEIRILGVMYVSSEEKSLIEHLEQRLKEAKAEEVKQENKKTEERIQEEEKKAKIEAKEKEKAAKAAADVEIWRAWSLKYGSEEVKTAIDRGLKFDALAFGDWVKTVEKNISMIRHSSLQDIEVNLTPSRKVLRVLAEDDTLFPAEREVPNPAYYDEDDDEIITIECVFREIVSPTGKKHKFFKDV
jgi:flagellar motor protein MotB